MKPPYIGGMVRLIPVEVNGKTVWIEDAPSCPAGHQGLMRPGWGLCPSCKHKMIRYWACRADGCDAPDLYDDEHQCA